MTATYSQIPGKVVSAANGVDYAYRATGDGTVPLLFLQHFRGNLDNWDPALIDALAATRRVATFDNAGAGGSTGTTPGTVEQMARDAIAFPDAMEFGRADIPGFSIGSFVAQDIALIRPEVVRRLILASSAPQGAAGTHGWAADVIAAVGAPKPDPDKILDVFYTQSIASRTAGQQAFQRMTAGTQDRDRATTWQTRQARYDAACAWGVPVHALLQRLSAIDVPVFVANGDSDPHDPALLLLLARRPDPAGPREDLPRLRTASCSSTTPSSPSTSMIPGSWRNGGVVDIGSFVHQVTLLILDTGQPCEEFRARYQDAVPELDPSAWRPSPSAAPRGWRSSRTPAHPPRTASLSTGDPT